MPKKTGPYIGVTGFTRQSEIKFALESIPHNGTHRLMVGVLMSSKTLRGEQNKWPNRYPRKEDVAGIFVDDPRALNLVHYSTDNPTTLVNQLQEIEALAGEAFDGFQLNVPWPLVEDIRKYRESSPDTFIVLQIGSHALNSLLEDVIASTAKLVAYRDLIDAILIDPSGGKGEPINIEYATAILRLVSEPSIIGGLGIGIAGGLGPDTLFDLDSIVREFPTISIDAEGRLRDAFNEDRINLDRVRIYLEDGLIILSGKELPGTRLYDYGPPYGFEGHIRNRGNGINRLRTTRLAQPGALQVGDILATGDKVLSPSREGGNGTVLIHLTGGFNGHWIGVPARIPIALLTKEDHPPPGLVED